jgi:hypothetical protein
MKKIIELGLIDIPGHQHLMAFRKQQAIRTSRFPDIHILSPVRSRTRGWSGTETLFGER